MDRLITNEKLIKAYNALLEEYNLHEKRGSELKLKIKHIESFFKSIGVGSENKTSNDHKAIGYRCDSTWPRKIIYTLDRLGEATTADISRFIFEKEPTQDLKKITNIINTNLSLLIKNGGVKCEKKSTRKNRRRVNHYSI